MRDEQLDDIEGLAKERDFADVEDACFFMLELVAEVRRLRAELGALEPAEGSEEP